MNDKRILIFHYFFPPASVVAAERVYSFCKALLDNCWEVHVITPQKSDCAYPDNAPKAKLDGLYIHYAVQSDLSKYRRGKQVIQMKGSSLIGHHIQRLYLRFIFPDKGYKWQEDAFKLAKKLHAERPFSLIFSSSPLVSSHLAALKMKNHSKLSWIAEFRDFYCCNNSDAKYFPKKAFKLESNILEEADKIIFVSEPMQRIYANDYPTVHKKSTVIYNGAQKPTLARPPKINKKKKILYAGTFYNGARNPGYFLDQFNHLLKMERLQAKDYVIQVAGPLEKHLIEKYVQEPVYQCLELLGAVNAETSLTLMQDADFFWLIVADLPHHKSTLPAKLFEYLYFEKPILTYAPKDAALFELEACKPYIVPLENNSGSVDSLFRALQINVDCLPSFGDFPFDRAKQSISFAAIADELYRLKSEAYTRNR